MAGEKEMWENKFGVKEEEDALIVNTRQNPWSVAMVSINLQV